MARTGEKCIIVNVCPWPSTAATVAKAGQGKPLPAHARHLSFYRRRQPVDVYLIRHADALALGERGISDDEERPLSDQGEEEARAAAKMFQKRGIVLDRLYCSPLLRARQTAEGMLRLWARSDLELQTASALAPGAKPRKLARFLLKQEGEKVGLVGHMPHLAIVTGWLIGDKDVQIELAKAGVAYVRCGEAPGKGLGVLEWLVTPEWYSS